MAKVPPTYIGIDVSKARFDMASSPCRTMKSFLNDRSGTDELVKYLCAVKPVLIVLEASGGIERALVRALVAAELPVAVANPRQVRDFAKATGKLAKTDALDAQTLARFAEAVRPALRLLPNEMTLELRALVGRRRQIIEILTAEKNRLSRASRRVQTRIQAHIDCLNRNWSATTRTSTKRSIKVLSGVSNKIFSRVCLVSDTLLVVPFWLNCLSWVV